MFSKSCSNCIYWVTVKLTQKEPSCTLDSRNKFFHDRHCKWHLSPDPKCQNEYKEWKNKQG
jgi:hypothetical protein